MQERQHVSRFSINCSDSVSSLAPPCQSHLLLLILLHLLLVQLASLQEYKVACLDGGPAANRCAYDCSILSSGHSRYCFTRFGTRVPKTVNKVYVTLTRRSCFLTSSKQFIKLRRLRPYTDEPKEEVVQIPLYAVKICFTDITSEEIRDANAERI